MVEQEAAQSVGHVPSVVEMQSEGGAAGALHGALQGGALATTFTASQGLLLMIPNMYKIAGELTAAVIHVAARSVAAQGLSIFGDHSDVMAVRQTGFALLASASVQEAHDLALVAQAATLASRVPFVHFFDGFRTSHELNTIDLLADDDLRALVPEELVLAHRTAGDVAGPPVHPRHRAESGHLFPGQRDSKPVLCSRARRGPARHGRAGGEGTGRQYRIVDYTGHPQAERVIVVDGLGAPRPRGDCRPTAHRRQRVGAVQMRLFRPFPATALVDAIPPTVARIAVLDRTKEPGSIGEPLFLDVTLLSLKVKVKIIFERELSVPLILGGRYGLSSKELTPAMVAGIFAELDASGPGGGSRSASTTMSPALSLPYEPGLDIEPPSTVRAVFFGLGSDGTVGANKNTIKILGERGGLHAQGYFVYDSKKSGSQTVSHLRFGPDPIRAPYLIEQASFVGCHQFGLLDRVDVLGRAAQGAMLLLNCAQPPDGSGTPFRARCRRRSSRSGSTFTPSTPARSRGRLAWLAGPIQSCRPVSSRSGRACCRARKRSRRSRHRSPRPTGTGVLRSSAQSRGRRPGAGRAAPDRGPRPRVTSGNVPPALSRPMRRSSSARSPRR